jgi:hypothetical protein
MDLNPTTLFQENTFKLKSTLYLISARNMSVTPVANILSRVKTPFQVIHNQFLTANINGQVETGQIDSKKDFVRSQHTSLHFIHRRIGSGPGYPTSNIVSTIVPGSLSMLPRFVELHQHRCCCPVDPVL